jgi:hypothetical protein
MCSRVNDVLISGVDCSAGCWGSGEIKVSRHQFAVENKAEAVFVGWAKAAKDVVMALNSDIALKLPDQNLGLAFVRPAAGLVASHQWAKRA